MEKNDYNEEPVYFCLSCLSLRVINDTGLDGLDYCDTCGSTNIDRTCIETWLKLYEIRYGKKYINK